MNPYLAPTRLLSVKEAAKRRCASRSTFYIERKHDPDMPHGVKIGRRTFFVEAEIEAWLTKKVVQGRAVLPMCSNP